jgi:hypothetical protein
MSVRPDGLGVGVKWSGNDSGAGFRAFTSTDDYSES